LSTLAWFAPARVNTRDYGQSSADLMLTIKLRSAVVNGQSGESWLLEFVRIGG
jgi:hypothetical protein